MILPDRVRDGREACRAHLRQLHAMQVRGQLVRAWRIPVKPGGLEKRESDVAHAAQSSKNEKIDREPRADASQGAQPSVAQMRRADHSDRCLADYQITPGEGLNLLVGRD